MKRIFQSFSGINDCFNKELNTAELQNHICHYFAFCSFSIDIKARVFYVYPITYIFLLMSWVTKTLHPSASAAPLSQPTVAHQSNHLDLNTQPVFDG